MTAASGSGCRRRDCPLARLQKVIASAGICSRRKAEELIRAGRVSVNGDVVTHMGVQVDVHRDKIEVDGRRIAAEPFRYIALHKPAGVVSTAKDPENRKTVLDLVPSDIRLYPVGRLDYDTEGLILLTNDGALTHRLTHPSYEVDKVYEAVLQGEVTRGAIKQLQSGVELDDGPTEPAKVSVLESGGGQSRILLTIHEGRNRQVRRMAEAVGFPVVRLKRLSVGPVELGRLKKGEWRPLTAAEVGRLRAMVGLERV